jgi:hypothetical protein
MSLHLIQLLGSLSQERYIGLLGKVLYRHAYPFGRDLHCYNRSRNLKWEDNALISLIKLLKIYMVISREREGERERGKEKERERERVRERGRKREGERERGGERDRES